MTRGVRVVARDVTGSPPAASGAPFPPRSLERFVPGFFLLLGVVGTFPVLRSLYVADLNWCYPYLSSDSYDWINNGLFWAGVPFVPSFRPPGLPLVIALLVKLGALSWLPVLNFVALGATSVLLFHLLRRRFDSFVSALTAWVFYANDFSRDLAKYVLAEVYATPLLVLAALLFLLAGRRPGLYVPFGLVLASSFLFHYAALPAAVGFAIAVLFRRRGHLRLRPLWVGAAAAVLVAGGWVLARALHYRSHPAALPHVQEALVSFVPGNIRFYALAGTALLGLAALPIYAVGALRMLEPGTKDEDDFRAACIAPLAGLSAFFFVFYDWIDKRFLFYGFPFVMAFFAEGADRLIAYGRRSRPLRAVVWGYLAAAILWTQIRYPSYGIHYLALTPRDFLEARSTTNSRDRLSIHLSESRVVRLHRSWPGAFGGGLFDYRHRPAGCRLDDPDYLALLSLKRKLDETFSPGAPVGLDRLDGWPSDPWLCWIRLANVLKRPVVRADLSPCRVTDREPGGRVPLLVSGRYRVVCGP